MEIARTILTPSEQRYCEEIAARIERIKNLLSEKALGSPDTPALWYEFLSELRDIQGNSSNDLSFVATLLAKIYLSQNFEISFCAAAKPQGAPGIDIDCSTPTGERIVAEIKTTKPYQSTDFGAQQAAMFKKDFEKLSAAEAKHKFLFVTEPRAFEVLKKPKYLKLMPGVRIVLLKTGEHYDV
jgi:hypothetical protein